MQNILLNLLKKKLRRYPHWDKLESFLNNIEKDDLKLVLLFGSLAKGTYTQHSDIDVLCVYNKEFTSFKQRFLISYKYSNGIVQPKTISYKEFKEALLSGNAFLHSILQDSFILFNTIPEEKLENWINEGRKKLKVRFFHPS
ncbi:MAG: nucleotidyltransferase domain-containing protein [Candidatus Helarchaeota archaeon]